MMAAANNISSIHYEPLPKVLHLQFDIFSSLSIIGDFWILQYLDIKGLCNISQTNHFFQERSRGCGADGRTSFYESLYKQRYYFEKTFPMFWQPRSYFDWKIRFKARIWKDRKLSPTSLPDREMLKTIDGRIEAVMTGRFFFYNYEESYIDEDEDENDSAIGKVRNYNYRCATTDENFVTFVQKYRENALKNGHVYQEEEPEWFEPIDNAKFVSEVYVFRPFEYGNRDNSVCYWDATGTHVYYNARFKIVTTSECSTLSEYPCAPDFASIPARMCANGKVNVNERELWTLMLFYGYLGTVSCDVLDRELQQMQRRVEFNGGRLISCDFCWIREGSTVLPQCSRCRTTDSGSSLHRVQQSDY